MFRKVNFDKAVPRPARHLPRDPSRSPSREILENMCFITGANSKYFEPLVELLESIKATRLYRNTPIHIIDIGLNNNHKHYLSENFCITKYVTPQEIITDSLVEDPVNQLMQSRIYLSEYFKDFDYIVWIDSDVWIQDERAVDDYLLHAEKYGIGVTNEKSWKFYKEDTWVEKNVCNKEKICSELYDQELFEKSPYCGCGVMSFNLNKTQLFFERWRSNYIKNVAVNGCNHYSEQIAFNVTFAQLHAGRTLSSSHNYLISSKVVVKDDSKHLLYTKEGEVAGCLHLEGGRVLDPSYYSVRVLNIDTGKKQRVSLRYRIKP